MKLVQIIDGLSQPLFVTEAPGSGTLYIVQQDGLVVSMPRATPGATQHFLDLRGQVSGGAEQGLLGLAFHPRFATGDARFVVDYTDLRGDTQVVEYQMVGGLAGGTVGPVKTRTLLSIAQPYANHNGGMVAFGPDGMLYVGMGDGGSGGDPQGNGQDLDTLLGKILRIDIGPPGDAHAGTVPRIPSDNPFANGGGRGEIWDYGMRNPWRFSFDAQTGDLWIGDVGQNQWEEVDLEQPGRGGTNYGWNAFEGAHPFRDDVDASSAVLPVAEYSHDGGRCSITGGYVYRGSTVPALAGAYLYADYCSGTIWALTKAGTTWTPRVVLETALQVSSFGEDAQRDIYVVDHGGAVYRMAAA